jgi:hypothetical protein
MRRARLSLVHETGVLADIVSDRELTLGSVTETLHAAETTFWPALLVHRLTADEVADFLGKNPFSMGSTKAAP